MAAPMLITPYSDARADLCVQSSTWTGCGYSLQYYGTYPPYGSQYSCEPDGYQQNVQCYLTYSDGTHATTPPAYFTPTPFIFWATGESGAQDKCRQNCAAYCAILVNCPQ